MTKTMSQKLRSQNPSYVVVPRPKIKKNKNKLKIKQQPRLLAVTKYQSNFSTPISAPIAGSSIVNRSSIAPQIQSSLKCTRVANTEIMLSGQIQFQGTGVGTRFAFIPAIAPWLDGIAVNFSKFSWAYLRFVYIPVCATTSSGTGVLAIGYDMTDVGISAPAAAQQSFRSVTFPPWAGWDGSAELHNYGTPMPDGAVSIEVDVNEFLSGDELSKWRYISRADFNGLATTTDQNVYTPGYIDVVTEGTIVGSGNVGGNLFVQYIIDLYEPINPAQNA